MVYGTMSFSEDIALVHIICELAEKTSLNCYVQVLLFQLGVEIPPLKAMRLTGVRGQRVHQ